MGQKRKVELRKAGQKLSASVRLSGVSRASPFILQSLGRCSWLLGGRILCLPLGIPGVATCSSGEEVGFWVEGKEAMASPSGLLSGKMVFYFRPGRSL